jgi:hypothetical protein
LLCRSQIRQSVNPSIRKLRDDEKNVLAHGFRRGIAEELFGAVIPERDDAVQRLADDSVEE